MIKVPIQDYNANYEEDKANAMKSQLIEVGYKNDKKTIQISVDINSDDHFIILDVDTDDFMFALKKSETEPTE